MQQDRTFVTLARTSDYGLFKAATHNRVVNPKSRHFRSLVRSMKACGFVSMKPIFVEMDPTDEMFIVHDGQHRLEAAREANVPLWYVQAHAGDTHTVSVWLALEHGKDRAKIYLDHVND